MSLAKSGKAWNPLCVRACTQACVCIRAHVCIHARVSVWTHMHICSLVLPTPFPPIQTPAPLITEMSPHKAAGPSPLTELLHRFTE